MDRVEEEGEGIEEPELREIGNDDNKQPELRDVGVMTSGSETEQTPVAQVTSIGQSIEQTSVARGTTSGKEAEKKLIALVVTIQALHMQVGNDDNEQRTNTFYTRCYVQDKVCAMLIDGDSCANLVSSHLVEQLELPTLEHKSPYRLQWMTGIEDVEVNRQCLLRFQIGKYQDEVLCDVAPIETGHILLGQPWQYDRRASRDGLTNKYSFLMNKRSIVLVPLTPEEVDEEQRILKQEFKSWPSEKAVEPRENEKTERRAATSFPGMLKEETENRTVPEDKLGAEQKEGKPGSQEYQDVFHDELPDGLPPLREIERQIDLVPRAVSPNRPAYRANPEEGELPDSLHNKFVLGADLSGQHLNLMDSRSNPFEEGGDDTFLEAPTKDPFWSGGLVKPDLITSPQEYPWREGMGLQVIFGPTTPPRTKRARAALPRLIPGSPSRWKASSRTEEVERQIRQRLRVIDRGRWASQAYKLGQNGSSKP